PRFPSATPPPPTRLHPLSLHDALPIYVNWRCPSGEVDIVAARDGALVFFEVKTRTSTRFGHPLEAISAAKLARMRRVAGAWLARSEEHTSELQSRFDLVCRLLLEKKKN